MPNTSQKPARRMAEPPGHFQKLGPIVNHPLFIGFCLLGAATFCGYFTMTTAAAVANTAAHHPILSAVLVAIVVAGFVAVLVVLDRYDRRARNNSGGDR